MNKGRTVRLGILSLTLAFGTHAADLRRSTLSAWTAYIESATAETRERVRSNRPFLKLDEDQNLLSRVRNGEITISQKGSEGLKHVPSGLIHDWSGATFIPEATLYQVLSVARDYDHFKSFYHPSVLDSRAVSSDRTETRFSMVLMNKSPVVNVAVHADYRCSYSRLNEHRWYSVCETTSVREIEDYGTPKQSELNDGHGKGLLWRLFSVAHFDERDGGVYLELEAIVLSRDIPVSLRWLIEPIVMRLSRSSLVTSLRQTEHAVASRKNLISATVEPMPAGTF